jgi:hypothetical protein
LKEAVLGQRVAQSKQRVVSATSRDLRDAVAIARYRNRTRKPRRMKTTRSEPAIYTERGGQTGQTNE